MDFLVNDEREAVNEMIRLVDDAEHQLFRDERILF